MNDKPIPTKLLGERIVEVIQGRIHHLYPTDVGLLTATQIAKRCKGLKVDKFRNRYNRDGWESPDLFLVGNIKHVYKEPRGQGKGDFDGEVDPELQKLCLSLSTKSRYKCLKHLELGTWERKYYPRSTTKERYREDLDED
jgi:hypothetical protein